MEIYCPICGSDRCGYVCSGCGEMRCSNERICPTCEQRAKDEQEEERAMAESEENDRANFERDMDEKYRR